MLTDKGNQVSCRGFATWANTSKVWSTHIDAVLRPEQETQNALDTKVKLFYISQKKYVYIYAVRILSIFQNSSNCIYMRTSKSCWRPQPPPPGSAEPQQGPRWGPSSCLERADPTPHEPLTDVSWHSFESPRMEIHRGLSRTVWSLFNDPLNFCFLNGCFGVRELDFF